MKKIAGFDDCKITENYENPCVIISLLCRKNGVCRALSPNKPLYSKPLPALSVGEGVRNDSQTID